MTTPPTLVGAADASSVLLQWRDALQTYHLWYCIQCGETGRQNCAHPRGFKMYPNDVRKLVVFITHLLQLPQKGEPQ